MKPIAAVLAIIFGIEAGGLYLIGNYFEMGWVITIAKSMLALVFIILLLGAWCYNIAPRIQRR